MATIGDDCYFFCTSTCSKGSACPFRHVEAAKTCRIICQHWQMGGCFRPSCKFRHSDFHIQVNSAEVPCYWESQPSGCKKLNCPYKHSKPRPEKEEVAVSKAPTPVLSQEESVASSENGSANSSLKFMRPPVVNPVVIEPDSEASNSSPIKTADKKKPEEAKEAVTKPVLNIETDSYEKEGKSIERKEKEGKNQIKGPKKKFEKTATIKKKMAGDKNIKPKSKQQKNASKSVGVKQKVGPKKMSVKERLGNAPKGLIPKGEENESSSSETTDSDDSIENVKVLSMEEIFRQKALESMMKKRAAEGKPMLPPAQKLKKPVIAQRSQPAKTLKKKPLNPQNKSIKSGIKQTLTKRKEPPKRHVVEEEDEEESEDDDEDDSDPEEENDDEESGESEEETEDDEEDSSGSTASESSESEEETEAPRRVIIDLDHAVKKRKKQVKGNLSKKPLLKSDVKAKKREVFRESALHDEPPSKKAKNVIVRRKSDLRNRLGKPLPELRNVDGDIPAKKIATKRKLIVAKDSLSEDSDKSNEDRDLVDIKIKTLEQIRAEKARKLQADQEPETHSLSPQRKNMHEIQPIQRTIMLRDEDNTASLSDPGTLGKDSKKVKRRPWKRQKTAPLSQAVEEEDQRTVSATSANAPMDDFQLELGKYKDAQQREEILSPESPTENLRRRALLKKALSQGLVVENLTEEPEKSSSKKHKHKHKHKKKSKIERQLYIPPAMKSSGTIESLNEDLVMPSDDGGDKRFLTSTDSTGDAPKKAEPQRAVARRVGALWAAGLNVPSKGLGARIVPKANVVPKPDFEKDLKPVERKPISLKTSKKESTDEGVTTIKTFSQIMAEKRQKRLQTMKANPPSENSNPSNQSESKPRVSVVPITFDSGDTTSKQPPKATGIFQKSPDKAASKGILPPSTLEDRGNNNSTAFTTGKPKAFFKKSSVDLPVQEKSQQIISSSLTSQKIEKKDSNPASISPSLPSSSSASKLPSSTGKDRKRHSMEDEFSFLEEDDDFAIEVMPEDAEPIDDLLQDIDDLLA